MLRMSVAVKAGYIASFLILFSILLCYFLLVEIEWILYLLFECRASSSISALNLMLFSKIYSQ